MSCAVVVDREYTTETRTRHEATCGYTTLVAWLVKGSVINVKLTYMGLEGVEYIEELLVK